MSLDALDAPWGALGEPPRRRVAWGSPVPQDQAPVARVEQPSPVRASAAPSTAPIPPATQETSMSQSPDSFAGLFGDDSTALAADDLGSLFGAPPAADPTSEPEPAEPPANGSGDLADLFGAVPAPAQPTAAVASAPEPEPEPEARPVEQEQPSAPAEPSSVTPIAAAEEADPEVSPAGAAEPAPAPAAPSAPAASPSPMIPVPAFGQSGAATPAVPAPAFGKAPAFGQAAVPVTDAKPTAQHQPEPEPAPRVSRVAEQRAHIAQARAERPSSTQMSAAAHALARSDRFTQRERLQDYVDRLLALGASGIPEVQRFIKSLELTRDHALDQRQRSEYQNLFEPLLASQGVQISSTADLVTIFDIAYDELIGIGPLGPLWRDDEVNEILVSGPNKVTVVRNGSLEITPVVFTDLEHLERAARTLGQVSADDRAVSSTNALVTIQLHRARVQFVWRPLAVAKVAIAIRKFGDLMGMDTLEELGALSAGMRRFLDAIVKARATVLVSGGTSSGKTTFINALSESIPDDERVITIEDALELKLVNTHVEAFVTKEAASADDRVLYGQDALMKAALRMAPDRIIVGEIRDGKGCVVMLEAANTGHAGTMTTVHANTPALAIRRMKQLLRKVDPMPDDVAVEEIASAIDVVVQVRKMRGRRFVSHIAVIDSKTGAATDIYVGEYPAGADAPRFRQVAPLGPDTDLALLMLDAGQDPSTWEVVTR